MADGLPRSARWRSVAVCALHTGHPREPRNSRRATHGARAGGDDIAHRVQSAIHIFRRWRDAASCPSCKTSRAAHGTCTSRSQYRTRDCGRRTIRICTMLRRPWKARGVAKDSVDSYFGMREISVVDLPGTNIPYVAINGKPVYLQLALDQAYHPQGFYTFPTDSILRNEIVHARQLGLTGLREHIKIEAPRKLYWADKLGVLIMADVPNWWGPPDSVAFPRARLRRERDDRAGLQPSIDLLVDHVQRNLGSHEQGERQGRLSSRNAAPRDSERSSSRSGSIRRGW